MKRKNKKSNIIKLGSETEAENGVYHLLKDGGRGKYAVWVQPYDKYQVRRIRSYKLASSEKRISWRMPARDRRRCQSKRYAGKEYD